MSEGGLTKKELKLVRLALQDCIENDTLYGTKDRYEKLILKIESLIIAECEKIINNPNRDAG